MQTSILESIRAWLTDNQIEFREIHHAMTRTSEESAYIRGEDLRVGGKALLLKTDDQFRLFVLPADRKFDSKAAKSQLGFRKSRFASAEELDRLTGLVPGSVPPFGSPILPFELFADQALTQNDRIAFNAGSLTDSVIMSMDDYLRLAQPTVFVMSRPADARS